MFCNKCGSFVDENASFCPRCGATLGTPANGGSANSGSIGLSETPSYPSGNTNYPSGNTSYPSGNTNYPTGNMNYQWNNTVAPTPAVQGSARLSRCRNCKTEFVSNGMGCPRCHSQNIDDKPDLWMGILALVFGILGGWLGFVFAGLGIKSAKRTKYQALKTMCTVAIVICAVSILFWAVFGQYFIEEFI